MSFYYNTIYKLYKFAFSETQLGFTKNMSKNNHKVLLILPFLWEEMIVV